MFTVSMCGSCRCDDSDCPSSIKPPKHTICGTEIIIGFEDPPPARPIFICEACGRRVEPDEVSCSNYLLNEELVDSWIKKWKKKTR